MSRSAGSGRRQVTGILLVDKPAGATSNRVLQRAKRLFNAAKAGHTGSLDPIATGMLPVCFGAATKVSGLLLDSSKSYRVTARLGAATDTGDVAGTVTDRRAFAAVGPERIAAELRSFLGESLQIPPMYSALKHHGRRLHVLARRGEEVPRPARPITIHEIELESVDWPDFEFRVSCSKGTYVRSLVADIAGRLGTVGHVAALRRLSVAPYSERQMITLEALEDLAPSGFEFLDAELLAPDTALVKLPSVSLDAGRAEQLRHGQRVRLDPRQPTSPGRVRIYAPEKTFLGLGEVDEAGELKPRRLFLA